MESETQLIAKNLQAKRLFSIERTWTEANRQHDTCNIESGTRSVKYSLHIPAPADLKRYVRGCAHEQEGRERQP